VVFGLCPRADSKVIENSLIDRLEAKKHLLFAMLALGFGLRRASCCRRFKLRASSPFLPSFYLPGQFRRKNPWATRKSMLFSPRADQ